MTSREVAPLLVRTPAQRPDESTWGYILRLSAANGYTSPIGLLALVGIGPTDASGLSLDRTKLAPALGENGHSLRSYMFNAQGTFEFQEAGLIPGSELLAGGSRVCVECFRESGFMPAWADLRLADACPLHKRLLATECAQCSQRLTWRRRSLIQCSCESELSELDCDDATTEHCDLVSCLIDLSQGRKPPDGMVPIGFGDMTLSRMLALCRGMASLYLRIFKDAKLSESQRAARMLKDWPRNVYRMIDVLAAGEETDVTHGGILLRRHAHWAYKQLFHYVRDAGDIAELSSVLVTCSGFPSQ